MMPLAREVEELRHETFRHAQGVAALA